MKRFSYLLAAAAVLAACGGNQGYTVTGTVEGAADGDTVYLKKVEGRQLVSLDSTVITNGTFTFKGVQDTVANRYLTYAAQGKEPLTMDFFLENGKINVNLTRNNDLATGTPNNDIYQAIRSQLNGLNAQIAAIFDSALNDSTLTDEQRNAKRNEIDALQEKSVNIIKEAVKQNITNAVGVHLLKQNYNLLN